MILAFIFSYCNAFLQLSFSFCLIKKKQKIKAAYSPLLHKRSPLKKKNSLRSNSFFFLTLHPFIPFNAANMRPVLLGTRLRHRLVGLERNSRCFARLLGWARLCHRSLALLLGKATVIEFRLD